MSNTEHRFIVTIGGPDLDAETAASILRERTDYEEEYPDLGDPDYTIYGDAVPLPEDDGTEPPRGSVVLAHGPTGTAFQRMHVNGLWLPAGGSRPFAWEDLVSTSSLPIIIAYRAPEEA